MAQHDISPRGIDPNVRPGSARDSATNGQISLLGPAMKRLQDRFCPVISKYLLEHQGMFHFLSSINSIELYGLVASVYILDV